MPNGRRWFSEVWGHLVLRRSDQAVIAASLFVALILLVVWWAIGRTFGNRVEFEQLGRQPLQFTVDINRATWPELAQLPGVGETLARRIVESRDHDGPFHTFSDLRRVHGMGKATLAEIAPFLKPIEVSKSAP